MMLAAKIILALIAIAALVCGFWYLLDRCD
jgi:hypothetical protein